jgi:hydrogenase maturation factor HypF (carbamoyltransferase family)
MNLICNKCNKETNHKQIRRFKYKSWYSCTECNNIQVVNNDN